MAELILEYTSLPNLHPALVHFPLALLPAGLLFETGLLARRGRGVWLDKAAAAVYATSLLGTTLAYWAGRQATNSLAALEPHVQSHLNNHSDWGLKTLWFAIVILGIRIGITLWDRKIHRVAPRAVLLPAAFALVGVVFYTADLGGALVYRHGVGVTAPQALESRSEVSPALSSSAAPAHDVTARLSTQASGSLHWAPLSGDGDALGSILIPAPGTTLAALAWIEAAEETRGLVLRVDGDAVVFLPGRFSDVQFTAELDLAAFSGEISLLHHAQGQDSFGFFTMETSSGEFLLGSWEDEQRVLDSAVHEPPDSTTKLTVSAIGRHLLGYLGDVNIVHGHEPARNKGFCGLSFRGQGLVRILSMTVDSVTE